MNFWTNIEPIDKKKKYIIKCDDGMIASVQYRLGKDFESINRKKAWRCDCCGKVVRPVAWCEYPLF